MIGRLAALLVSAALLLAGCGGSPGVSRGSGPAVPGRTVEGGGDGQGAIAGRPFTAGSAFAQYDPSQKVWWLVVGSAGHSCGDVTSVAQQIASAVVPNVNVDFPAKTPTALPPSAPQTTVGVVFVDRTGYPTTINGSGATVTVSRAEPQTGGHWSASITVPTQNTGGKGFGFKGTFTATVCPPAKG